MKVVFIGAGNVATHLAVELYRHSFDIIQVYSRTMESASVLAQKIHATPITDISSIDNSADLYIFSLKDSVLEDVISHIPSNNGLWIHTAGSIPVDVFRKYALRFGVFYPFQTFSKGREADWREIPVFIEANNQDNLDLLRNIAEKISDKVAGLSSQDRRYVHLTGVFACNFANHMYTLSKQFLNKVNLSFDVSLPLIDETAAKVHVLGPEEAQTGPAVRYDENVINKHLDLIEDENIRQIYKLISENIYKTKKR
ncbi:MAG: DUF2520 domain-containing protein [Prevotella sp.]|jgi:predicted short-subunit dehydrogenase-like oxidoreductase (DUF2520 family)|nr:DUF2520 domain-containing protein [Prevotella sp.]